MRALLDTSILVRHLTGDPPAQAKRVTAFLAAGHELILADLILAEVVCVLESYDAHSRSQIAEAARSLLAFPSVAASDHELLLRAIELYEGERLDFADAYPCAAAELSGVGAVASFDRAVERVTTVRRVEPWAASLPGASRRDREWHGCKYRTRREHCKNPNAAGQALWVGRRSWGRVA